MALRLKVSGIVAMILFIPLLLALGVIFAFVVPLMAIMAAVGGIVFTTLYILGRREARKQHGLEKEKVKQVDVKDYKIK